MATFQTPGQQQQQLRHHHHDGLFLSSGHSKAVRWRDSSPATCSSAEEVSPSFKDILLVGSASAQVLAATSDPVHLDARLGPCRPCSEEEGGWEVEYLQGFSPAWQLEQECRVQLPSSCVEASQEPSEVGGSLRLYSGGKPSCAEAEEATVAMPSQTCPGRL